VFKQWHIETKSSQLVPHRALRRDVAPARAASPRRLRQCRTSRGHTPPESTHFPQANPCPVTIEARAAPRAGAASAPYHGGRALQGLVVRPRLSSLVRRTTAGVHHPSSHEQVSCLFKRPLACEYWASRAPLPLLTKLAPPLASRASQPPLTRP
jgi:hypothetical protein